MLVTSLAVCLGLVQPTGPQVVEEAAPREEPGASIVAVIARVRGLDELKFREALAPRLPDVRILPFERASFEAVKGPGLSFVDVSVDGDEAAVTVVLQDGRAYLRHVAVDPRNPERSVGRVVATTLVAIAEEQIEPDRSDAAMPEPEPEPEPAPESRPELPPRPDERPGEPDTPPPRPRVEVAPVLHGGVVIGLGVPGPAGLSGGGGGGGLDVRFPAGALISAGFRAIARGGHGHTLARYRIAVGAGYAVRHWFFEMPLTGFFTVEPWAVVGQTLDRTVRPLLGGALRLSPGARIPLRGRIVRGLRVGARVELAGSVLPSGGAARVLEDAGGTERELFRAGGLELSVGAGLALWLSAPRRAQAPSPPVCRPTRPRSGRWSGTC